MTTLQQLRKTLEKAFAMAADKAYGEVAKAPRTLGAAREFVEMQGAICDALKLLDAIDAEQKTPMLFTTNKGQCNTTNKGQCFGISGINATQPSPASESGNKQAPVYTGACAGACPPRVVPWMMWACSKHPLA